MCTLERLAHYCSLLNARTCTSRVLPDGDEYTNGNALQQAACNQNVIHPIAIHVYPILQRLTLSLPRRRRSPQGMDVWMYTPTYAYARVCACVYVLHANARVYVCVRSGGGGSNRRNPLQG